MGYKNISKLNFIPWFNAYLMVIYANIYIWFNVYNAFNIYGAMVMVKTIWKG